MLVVIVIAIAGGWVGAFCLRRRYLRKKEREIEMRPPVAWGPHQLQGMTGGFDSNAANAGGHQKEASMGAALPVATQNGKRESKGWLKKNRN